MNYSVINPLIESCCETIKEAQYAAENGANRIEFCARLDLQGLTPKVTDILELSNLISIPIRPIIRPVDSFQCSKTEIGSMINSIEQFSDLKIEGFVLGLLDPNSRVDWKKLEILLRYTKDLPITFHKAIDASSSILDDVSILNNYPTVDYLLSSGGHATAMEGKSMILKMKESFNNNIIAGGKITKYNLNEHKTMLNLNAYHGRKII